jgi:glycogen debranching enzyme
LPIQFYEYILYSGDLAFADEILPTAKRITDEFIRRIDANGLIKCFQEEKYWNFYEWQQGLAGSISGSVSDENATYDAPLNAFFIMTLKSMSKLYSLLKDKKNSDYYKNIAHQLAEAVDKNFWNNEKQLYATYLHVNGKLGMEASGGLIRSWWKRVAS